MMRTRILIQALIVSLLCIAFTAFAASSFTPNYNLEMPAEGDTGWADALNSNALEIDEQMFINQNSIQAHIADTTAAHAGTAISTSVGSLVCTSAITVQAFLECLDSELGALTTGAVVTINTDQTIIGQKTFSAQTIFSTGITVSAFSTGVVKSDVSGVLSSSPLLNIDVDDAAGIEYSKLDLADSIVDEDINGSAGITYSKLDLADSIVDADINSAAAISYSKLDLSDSIVDADIDSAAAIAGTKIDPDFGSQDIETTGDVISPIVKAQSSAGIIFQANNGTQVADFGAGGGSQAVFEGALETNTSLIIQDPGAGTDAVTIVSPTLSGSYTLTLPVDDGNANQVLGTNGSGVTSWVDATSGYSQNSDVTLTASDTIAIGTGNADRLQHWRVQGASGAVTLSSTPFGTSPPQDRTIICLAGTSDANTVTIEVNDAADGVVGNGNVTLGQYESACFRYLLTEDRYIIESRSN